MTATMIELLDKPAIDTVTDPKTASKRVLVCRRCSAEVTTDAARIERNGAHAHTRINPDGDVFQFGCFSTATVRLIGEPTTEFTWFPGYAWTIAVCHSCGTHLGWRYGGAGEAFFGLVLDALA